MYSKEQHKENMNSIKGVMRLADSIMEDIEQAQGNYMHVQIAMENIIDFEKDCPQFQQVSDLFFKLRKATDEVLAASEAMWRIHYDREANS